MTRSVEEHLTAFLAERDYPCPLCKYNLRGIEGTACPECGARLDLQVGTIDLKLGPWLLAVLAVAAPMGFNGVLGIVAAIGAWRSLWWDAGDWIVLGVCWVVANGCAVLLYLVSRRRKSFLKRTRAQQWTRAGLLALAMAVLQAGLLWLIIVAL